MVGGKNKVFISMKRGRIELVDEQIKQAKIKLIDRENHYKK